MPVQSRLWVAMLAAGLLLNTDTTFGIVVESNFTVCTQDPPRGEIVVVLAQKYGC